MKTLFDELQYEVKNWWMSLLLGILYVVVAISLMFAPFSGYAVLSILFSISMLFSGLLEISFRRKQPEECFQLGLVSGRWYHRHGIRFLSDSLSAVKHGSNSIHHRILVNVPRLFFHRLCHGSEKIWYQRLGMVYCLRHISCDLFTPHSVATGNRRHVCCLHDLICIPYYRIFSVLCCLFELKNLHKRGRSMKDKNEEKRNSSRISSNPARKNELTKEPSNRNLPTRFFISYTSESGAWWFWILPI